MKKYEKILLVIMCCALQGMHCYAQSSFTAIIADSATGEKLSGVAVVVENTTNGAISDSNGMVVITNIGNGLQKLKTNYVGYKESVIVLQFPLRRANPTIIRLQSSESEMQEVIVTSMRTNSRIEDAPIKVEVLGADDLTEESTLKPGNVSSILGDVSGVQIQQTSAVSGNSVGRMQGLNGKYTALMRDGMPAYGGLSGGLSILQIPPLDLKQVEIIKGPSSTINGGGAISGVINFITKEPTDTNEATFVLSQSSLLETNLDAYLSGRKGKIGYTLFAGCTHQFALDVNKDGFSDVPRFTSFLIHPQLFFYPNSKTKVRIGFIANYENRLGGDVKVIRNQTDSTHQYFERNISENYGADFLFSRQLNKGQEILAKASLNYSSRDFSTNVYHLKGGQWNSYAEAYYHLPKGKHDFITGASYVGDVFKPANNDTSGYSKYSYLTVGLFAQYGFLLPDRLNFQVGLRADWHNKFGFFVLPSAALLLHATKEFSIRINGGTGYKVPNLLEIAGTDVDFSMLNVSSTLRTEQSYGGTFEWNYRKLFQNRGVSLFINQTFFYTYIHHAILETLLTGGDYAVANVTKGVTSLGIDNYVRVSKGPVDVYLGYTFTYPRNNGNILLPYLSLTPLHRAAGVVTVDIGKHFKAGVEGSLVGKQYLDDGTQGKIYFLLAASVQYHVKRVTLVLNGENLLDARQTRFSPVVYGSAIHPQFAQLWAPVDGRVINFSLMVKI